MSKIQKPSASQVRAPATKQAPARPDQAASAAPTKGWAAKAPNSAQKLAAAQAAGADATAKHHHPLLEKVGKAVGLGLGVAVTEGLRLVPGWDKPVLDRAGKPVAAVPGATREGNYEIRKRHEEVIGPQVAEKATHIKPGMLHDLVAGLGEGASEAPGASYRIDARLDHALHPGAKKPGA